MVMVTFAEPVMFAWCLSVSVRALPEPPIAAARSAGRNRFGLSLLTVIRAPVLALLINAVAAVSASANVKVIAVSVATPGSA